MKKQKVMFKKVLPLLLCITILSSTVVPPKKTHAIAPALLWIVEALVVEIAVELGWKYVGKEAFDKVKGKVTKIVLDNISFFDFFKKNPKKNGKKLDIDISPLDRQKIAKLLKDEADDIIEKDTERRKKSEKPRYDLDYPEGDPLDDTSVSVDLVPSVGAFGSTYAPSQQGVDFMTKMYHWVFTPVPYVKRAKIELKSAVDGSVIDLGEFGGSDNTTPKNYEFQVAEVKANVKENPFLIGFRVSINYYTPYGKSHSSAWVGTPSTPTRKAWETYLTALQMANRVIYMADGIMIPEENTKIYNVPVKAPSGTQLPNTKDLDIDISIDLPNEDTTVYDIDWEQLTKYEVEINNYQKYYIDKGDTNITNNYDVTIINKYYTDIDYTEKEDDVIIKDPDEEQPPDEEEEEGGGWFKDLLPVALLIVMFDLIVSCLMYLVRLFTFIMTIPIIEAIPIDNPAFQWFKGAKIMGVQIYNVVSSLATFGLSFSVYKAIRRLFS